jgi:hypothetical protein
VLAIANPRRKRAKETKKAPTDTRDRMNVRGRKAKEGKIFKQLRKLKYTKNEAMPNNSRCRSQRREEELKST